MPHVARFFDILDFQIRNRGLEMRVPVDEALALVDQPFVVEINKGLHDSLVHVWAVFMADAGIARRTAHGEGGPLPITRRAEALKLVRDSAAGLLFPFPDFLDEGFAAHRSARGFLVLHQLTFNNHLRCNARMVRTRLPKRIKPAHPVPTDQDVLQGVIERVPHVQAARDVGRRDHNGKGLVALFVRASSKALGVFPRLIDAGFSLGGVKGLFHRHCGGLLLDHSHRGALRLL